MQMMIEHAITCNETFRADAATDRALMVLLKSKQFTGSSDEYSQVAGADATDNASSSRSDRSNATSMNVFLTLRLQLISWHEKALFDERQWVSKLPFAVSSTSEQNLLTLSRAMC